MKNNKSLCLYVLFTTLCVSSCGVNTKNWPHIKLEFSSSEAKEVKINYERKENKYAQYLEDTLSFSDVTSIEKVMNLIGNYPYKEECEKNIGNDYTSKILVNFEFNNETTQKYKLEFYQYGISDGKVVFNNGEIHFITGDISAIYEEMK